MYVWPFSSWQLILTVQDFPLPDAARPRFGDSRVSLEPLLVHGKQYPVPNIWYQPVLNSTQLTTMVRQTCFQWGSKGGKQKGPSNSSESHSNQTRTQASWKWWMWCTLLLWRTCFILHVFPTLPVPSKCYCSQNCCSVPANNKPLNQNNKPFSSS